MIAPPESPAVFSNVYRLTLLAPLLLANVSPFNAVACKVTAPVSAILPPNPLGAAPSRALGFHPARSATVLASGWEVLGSRTPTKILPSLPLPVRVISCRAFRLTVTGLPRQSAQITRSFSAPIVMPACKLAVALISCPAVRITVVFPPPAPPPGDEMGFGSAIEPIWTAPTLAVMEASLPGKILTVALASSLWPYAVRKAVPTSTSPSPEVATKSWPARIVKSAAVTFAGAVPNVVTLTSPTASSETIFALMLAVEIPADSTRISRSALIDNVSPPEKTNPLTTTSLAYKS